MAVKLNARYRYTGLIRHAIQNYSTFMALNLKRPVKLLKELVLGTGLGLVFLT